MEIVVQRHVAASPQRVRDIVTAIEASPGVISAVEGVERLDQGAGFDVGMRWRETRTMFGRQATEEMAVTAVDAPRSYTTTSVNGATTCTSTISVQPGGRDGCVLRMSFAGRSSGVVNRLLAATVGRLFAGATRRALRQDLDDIADHAEADRTA